MTDLAQISRSLGELHGKVDGIDKKLDAQKLDLDSHEERDRQDFATLHSRVTRNEKKTSWIIGVGSGLTAVSAAVLAWLKGDLTG
jgi:hypothetical protein